MSRCRAAVICQIILFGLLAGGWFTPCLAQEQPVTRESFALLDLTRPGLEKVNTAVTDGQYENAAKLLLHYYRSRTGVKHPTYNLAEARQFAGKKVNETVQQQADDALQHRFKPHKAYPTYDYGKDINWQYRPVQDQLVSTFLHRTAIWEPLGLVYRSTGDERYAQEWVFQVRDWIRKNKQGAYPDDKDYAWKAFVTSFRLNYWSGYFNLFLNSPHCTPAFLMEFLNSYNEQANYVQANFTDIGNHRLFEALHMLYAGGTFPELKNAAAWRKSGIAILNAEIQKQVLPDGMQFELSLSYHVTVIKIFLDGLRVTQLAGLASEFPASYLAQVEKMVLAVGKYSFPDYTFPLYGNSFLTTKSTMLKSYAEWASVFPQNKLIAWYASEGATGQKPDYLSSALPNAGFYTFRSGWDAAATVLEVKAGPPAGFHSQPDNGTFDLWVRGRNFTPDAGSYVYANVGDQVNAKRDWYRSTKAHQTLTLDDRDLTNKATRQQWDTGQAVEVLRYTNPSYPGLSHQRTFLFVDHQYFIIIDQAAGATTGKLGIHFNLKEDAVAAFDEARQAVHTQYPDGNNLLIQGLSGEGVRLSRQESFVSYEYQKEQPRPAFVFEKQKPGAATQRFVTVVYPYQGSQPPVVQLRENPGNDFAKGTLRLTLTIDGATREIKTTLTN